MRMRKSPRRSVVLCVLVLGASTWGLLGTAHAHFNLIAPPPADSATDGGKGAPPCGPTMPSNVVTKVQGGHPLAISITEYVFHPGYYRFALSINARSELPADPAVMVKNGQSVSATIESPAVFPVLADGMFQHTTSMPMFTGTIPLPNITCAKCTLQVIEFMAEHGLNVGGGYFYHHCADLQITADPSLPDGGTIDAAGSEAGSPARDAGGMDIAGGSGGSVGSGGASASGGASGTGGGVGTGGVTLTASGGSPGSGGSLPVTSTSTGGSPVASSSGGTTTAGTGTGSSGGSSSGCSLAGGELGSSGALCMLLMMGVGLRVRRRRVWRHGRRPAADSEG